ncbi:MAG: bifunctional UDP-N-acetylmuramoyl-tripeptide:D-alanyl-D-alanine ligase/alanine racemase [Haliscomenobacter sp.]|nr:bifunctional UDP-N-acetylmuramoyl-tripeptide:D-alanyl-D-alanine ligase/alanine racemase [Haliscomenobacter sp.]
MPYSIEEIIRALGARCLQGVYPVLPVEHLLYDSRQLFFAETGIFFALTGKRHDGHAFIAEAYAEGVRNMVVSRPVPLDGLAGANVLLVEDTLRALQALAAYHRRQFNPLVVGITGSNGKTIVKEWLFQMLQEDHALIRSPKSFNSQVGVPISVWQLNTQHQMALIEAGISKMGEMAILADIIRPEAGLFTNLGEAHSEGFPSAEVKLDEKLRLFQTAGKIVYCRDDERVDEAIRKLKKPVFTWSRRQEADLRIVTCRTAGRYTILEGIYQDQTLAITIPFTDAASIENAIHCWAFMLFAGVPPERIPGRMEQLKPVAMRLELKEGARHSLVINDAYNFDLTSLSLALHFLDQHAQGLSRTVILSDMLQGQGEPASLYQRISQMLQEQNIGRLVGVGKEVRRLNNLLPDSVRKDFFDSTEALLDSFDALDFDHEILLIKGARSFGLERVAERLSRQVHQTVLEINLNALAHNLRVYQRQLLPATKIMVMVKAAAYGSGSREVARLLEFQRIDYLCVAYGDEGAELRQAGVQTPIMVLNPEPATFDQLLRYRLEPKVYSLVQLQALLDYFERQSATLPLHISIDSGMHRLGFDEHEISALVGFLKKHPGLDIRTVFSHLAASEDPRHDDYTHEQYRRFAVAYEDIAGALGYRPMRHLLNSNGISRFSQYQMEMVRLGIGLYGIDASESLQEKLQVVLTLNATVSQVKELAPGESVGYGRLARADQPMRMATISIGYADGLPRKAGNRRFSVVVRGKPAPVLGAVCMDMCMIDISDNPDVVAGDPVFIFGKNPSVETLAAAAETIPYEIFTGISSRVKRVYVQE